VKDRNNWNFVPTLRYPIPNGVSLKLDACFGSSYLRKMEFSTIKTVKSKYRRSLTDKHINDCMRVTIAKYTPNYYKLVEEMQCQVSHCILQFCLDRLLSWDTIYPHTALFKERKPSLWSIKYISYIIICFSCSLCLMHQFSCYISYVKYKIHMCISFNFSVYFMYCFLQMCTIIWKFISCLCMETYINNSFCKNV